MQHKINYIATLVAMCSLLSVSLVPHPVFGQRRRTSNEKGSITAPAKEDSPAFGTVQPYSKIITPDAILYNGLFRVSKVKDRYYFEIPDSLLDRDIHIVSRIAEGPAKLSKMPSNFAGDDLGDAQISFSRAPNNKLFIRQLVYRDKASDTSAYGLHRALLNNNLQPVLSVFDIRAFGKDSAAVVDMTDYLNGDQQIITGNLKSNFSVQGIQTDKSYIETVYAYPGNIDIQMVKTYSAASMPITLKMNTSFILMPKTAMPERFADERVGYRTLSYNDFDIDQQRVRVVEKICKWRVSPREADKQAYIKGELVEPEKPIVFYIDPNTPRKWVPYLIQAVNDWQPAFEHAGFKNAIYARETSAGDSTWDTRDDRFNTIIYAPSISSDIKSNIIIDPRSGEIMHANIHVDHNVLQQLYDLYLIQAGNIDPEARKPAYNTQLMGRLLQSVVSSEVGNTLGLVNNAGASAMVPVSKLKDPQWVRKHGFNASILRNVLINYTATPEDHFSPEDILAKVGEYDRWAIDWGYRWLPQFRDAYDEQPFQRKRINDSLIANPALFFSPEAKEIRIDARAMPASLGDDPVKASYYGIQNLKTIVPQLSAWTQRSDQLYSIKECPLGRAIFAVLSLFNSYLDNVTGVFGTVYYNPHNGEGSAPVYGYVPIVKQENAIRFLNQEIFIREPLWLTNSAIADRGFPLELNNYLYEPGQRILAMSLLDLKVIKNIAGMADRFGPDRTISLSAYLSELEACIWPELLSVTPVSNYHMALERTFINSLGFIVDTKRDVTNTAAIALVRGYLVTLKQKLAKAQAISTDGKSKQHYQDMLSLIAALTDPRRPVPVQIPGAPKGVNQLNLLDGQKLDF